MGIAILHHSEKIRKKLMNQSQEKLVTDRRTNGKTWVNLEDLKATLKLLHPSPKNLDLTLIFRIQICFIRKYIGLLEYCVILRELYLKSIPKGHGQLTFKNFSQHQRILVYLEDCTDNISSSTLNKNMTAMIFGGFTV